MVEHFFVPLLQFLFPTGTVIAIIITIRDMDWEEEEFQGVPVRVQEEQPVVKERKPEQVQKKSIEELEEQYFNQYAAILEQEREQDERGYDVISKEEIEAKKAMIQWESRKISFEIQNKESVKN